MTLFACLICQGTAGDRLSLILQVVSVFIVIGAAFFPIGYACLRASKSVYFLLPVMPAGVRPHMPISP